MTAVTRDAYTDMQRLVGPHAVARVCNVTVAHRYGPRLIEVKAELAPANLPEAPTDRQVRQALLDAGNDAIDAVLADGYWLTGAPRIDFYGEIARTWGPGTPRLITQAQLRLELGFPEDRPA
jgi:hypothetical protein